MKFTTRSMAFIAMLLVMAMTAQPLLAQKKKKDKDKAPAAKEKKDEIKELADVTKKCAHFEGLFDLYQDTANGDAYMLIKAEQVGKEYIYFSHIVDGVLDAGHFRGSYRGSRIFEVEQRFDKVEFRLKNTSYYFDPDNAVSKAADANVNEPIFMSQKIYAANKDRSQMLIKADDVFLTEIFQQIKYSAPSGAKPGSYFDMGKLSKDKSRIKEIRNYPENSDVIVEYIYENAQPKRYGSAAVTDARYTSIVYQHSLIQVPDNDFRPRFDDPRVGYFNEQVDDQTATDASPYRDLISRWHLKKKDPTAAVSEPVEPITWWLENTTPIEVRDAVRRGVESWNLAFEKAGFKNAIVVKQQPDDADWDAGDIRYNVLRWTSSPQPPFGGYGPSFINPRNGQILGADVMLEYVFITNRLRQSDLFETAAMDMLRFDEPLEQHNDAHLCHFGQFMQHNLMFGKQVLEAKGISEADKERFVQEGIADLALHEVGHTLGLAHNMKASNLNTPEELKDKATTMRKGLTGSVMDYAPANLAPGEGLDLQYFNLKPGPYDDFAIAYGYSEFPEEIEEMKLKEILDRSSNPDLMYGNDADDMRGSGRGVDPRVMIFDMSSDPVQDGLQRIQMVNDILPTLKDKYTKGSQSHQELLYNWYVLTGTYSNALWVMTRQIGGVHVDRSFTDQDTPNKPYQPVPRETQEKAMDALAEYAFGPNAYEFQNDLLNYLQMEARGWSHWGRNEDPHMHDRVYYSQMSLLNQLMHSNVLQRIKDSELYGNEYPLDEYMGDLTDAIFKADRATSANSYRQNLQQLYVDRLIGMINGKGFRNFAQNMALYELNRIERWMKSGAGVGDRTTKAHRERILFKIKKAKEAK